jgi:NitT/TauT family transport system ATP-binding protein
MKDSSKTIILEVNGITKSFDGELHNSKLEVMKELNFSVNHGEVFSILGPNGSGKTTIVNIIAGLLKQDAGYVEFDGHRVVGPSRERTVVFQNLALFPWRTCKGNILFALKASARERTENRDERKTPDDGVLEYLKIADLINFADAYPIDLSGGMKQRLALTRALAVSPKLILMDEPFASFDPLVRESSQETILNLLSHTSTTVLLVTHDLDEAIFMSDRILVLSERPARIKEIIHVPFERPRISKIRKDVRFHELRTYIWDLLRSSQEVKKTSTSS